VHAWLQVMHDNIESVGLISVPDVGPGIAVR
jgi:hypothetical protein